MKILSIATLIVALSSACAYAANPVVTITTNKGVLEVELFEKESPVSVQNFLTYVNEKYYDGLIFHRVIQNFMIQTGGFAPGMNQKQPTHEPIQNESKNGIANAKGTIAMARTGAPHSAAAQFFINTKNNVFLNGSADKWGYAVFGKVIKGMDVVSVIENGATSRTGRFSDVPQADIIIVSVVVKK